MRPKAIAVFLILVLAALAAAQERLSVTVNGEAVRFVGAGPQSIGGRVFVPLRGVMEKLGAFVGWDAPNQTVRAQRGTTDLELRIGSRTARINGRDVPLDVPAQISGGTTLVPLRFMAEALGATVRFDAATQTVHLSTSSDGIQPDPGGGSGTGSGAPNIRRFTTNAKGWLRAGDVAEFTLVGAPDGKAVLQIPGASDEVAMRETQAGTYVARWTVPSGDTPRFVREATALARLSIGTNERMIQLGTTFGVDTGAPRIRSLNPEQGTNVTQARPDISAVLEDAGSGIDRATVRVVLNGRDVTRDATVTSDFIVLKPSADLPNGVQQLEITAKDLAGNETEARWSFRVNATAATETGLATFVHNISGPVRAGQQIAFNATGAPKSTVTVRIGDKITNLRLVEQSPGRYFGRFTVRERDRFENESVVATLRTAEGQTFTRTAERKITSAPAEITAPRVTAPKADEAVGSSIVVRGTAAPRARVVIRIDYESRVLGGLGVRGSIGEFEATADDQGAFATDSIRLDTLLGRGDVTYTLTAIAVGGDDRRSKETVVRFRRN